MVKNGNTVKLIWSGEINQTNEGFMWKGFMWDIICQQDIYSQTYIYLNEGDVNLKICGILYINKTYADTPIKPQLGLLAEMVM